MADFSIREDSQILLFKKLHSLKRFVRTTVAAWHN